MTEALMPYLLNVAQNSDTVDAHNNSFVDVRTKAGKLIFRFDPLRRLVEWREGKNIELVDLKPLMPE